YRVFSQSGWGVLCGWDNDPAHALPPYYESVCGFCGEDSRCDFSDWNADAVILNLGTNDEGAMHNPPFSIPDTGGSFVHPGLCALEHKAVSFLTTVRRCNPNAILIWAYGMLGFGSTGEALRRAMERYRAETGDNRAYFVELPNTTAETMGARQHPGAESHRRAAEVLIPFLKEEL
ncbi:MAG: GDSL family lipase, partial [Gemmiger sp.]